MKRIVVSILFLLVLGNAVAQRRFKIEPIFSLHYPMLPDSITFGDETFTNLEGSLVSYYRGSSGGGLNRSIGFQGEIPVLQSLSVRLGAAYAPKDFIADWSNRPRDQPWGANDDSPIMFKQRYVDVPLSLRWYFVSKRLLVFAEAGAVLNILVLSKAQYESTGYASKTSMSRFEDFYVSKYMIGVSGGLGIGYALNNRADLMFTTNYRHALTEYTPTDTYRPRAIVASISFAIKFGKGSEEGEK